MGRPPRVWTADEQGLLKALWGSVTAAEIARRLGRDTRTVKIAARRAGLPPITATSAKKSEDRAWTAEEIATLDRLYRRLGVVDIARRLGRTYCSVRGMAIRRKSEIDGNAAKEVRPPRLGPDFDRRLAALQGQGHTDSEIARRLRVTRLTVAIQRRRLGLAPNPRTRRRKAAEAAKAARRSRLGPDFDRRLASLQGQGHTDPEIARRLGASRRTVGIHRRKLGLGSNARSDRRRAAVGVRARAQCEEAGVESLGAYRSLVHRVDAVKAGRSPDLRPRAVAILDLLEARGPMTRRQISDALGLPWHGPRRSLKSRDPEGTYLANLMARGIVFRYARDAAGQGRGRGVFLYALAPGAERRNPRDLSSCQFPDPIR